MTGRTQARTGGRGPLQPSCHNTHTQVFVPSVHESQPPSNTRTSQFNSTATFLTPHPPTPIHMGMRQGGQRQSRLTRMPERVRASNHRAEPRNHAPEAPTGGSVGLLHRHPCQPLHRPYSADQQTGPHPLHQVLPHPDSLMRGCPSHTRRTDPENRPFSRSQVHPPILHVRTSSTIGKKSTHPSLRGSNRGRTFSQQEAICSVLTNRHRDLLSARRFLERTHLTKEHKVCQIDCAY